ncbi:hypothetical protein [Desulfobacter sp.]|jgi:hypothetical protein|uniref:hypothetical protein n=1 Tax=Desulfobacter sp. TaxID=2294 RepID=UPI000E81D6D9|nr:hypothetical protein [Desulfobacter sp.]HBT90004.1 hypothetical protein [Desulfobacter sp.]
MSFLKRILIFVSLVLFGITGRALATTGYTSLISSDMFDGIRTDVNTAAAGIVTILIIVVGLGLLVKVFR